MALAKEAMEVWATWPLLKRFYHRSGWVAITETGSDLAERIRRNYREAGDRDPTRDMSFEEVREINGGLLKDIDLEGCRSAYWNGDAGWVEADKAVGAMLEEALGRGVTYLQGEVKGVVLKEGGKGAKGVRLGNGRVVEADRIVVATGAWTSMVMSGVEDELGIEEDERTEKQVKAAGVCVAHYQLDAEEKKKFDNMPVVVFGENGALALPLALIS